MNASRLIVALSLAGLAPAQARFAAPPEARIVVTSQDDASISEIDPLSGSVVARVAVGRGPAGLAVSANGQEIFTTHPDTAVIDVVDAATGRVVRSLPYKGEPFGIAAGPGVVYVSDWSKDIVTRLDAVTGAPTGLVSVGKSPAGIVADPVRHRLYVANREDGNVTIVSTESMREIARIVSGQAPFALALSPDGSRLYVANVRSNDLAVIDTTHLQRIATVAAGAMPYGVAVTPDGSFILVTNQHGNTLSIVDAGRLKVVAAVPVGRYPEGVIVADDRAYVANWFSGDVSVVDLAQRREIARIKVGDGPRNFARLAAPTGEP